MIDGIFPTFNKKKLTTTWNYCDEDGNVIGITARYDNDDYTDKDIVPYFNKEHGKWKTGAPTNTRPLFGLYALSKDLTAPIMVCEGEKAASAAQQLLPGYAVITSLGGAKSAHKTDWLPVKGRTVVIWPDNDSAGLDYAKSVSDLAYKAGATRVSIIQIPEGKPKAWDAADALEEGYQRDELKALLEVATIVSDITTESEKYVIPLFDIDSARIDEFLSSPAPIRRYLLEDCLPLGVVGMLVAPGGTGKSMLALQLAVSTAIGTNVAGAWEVEEPGTVLALFAEDDTPEIHRRVQCLVDSMNLTNEEKEILQSHLFIKSMIGIDNFITSKSMGSEALETDYINRLMESIKGLENLKLIIIDPASRFRGGNEIDNDDATRFIIALEKLSNKLGVTVLFLHHANKASMSSPTINQGAARGASALVDGVRWVMNLTGMTEAEGKTFAISNQRNLYVKATVTKNNYAPPQAEDIWLYRAQYGVLHYVVLSDGKMDEDIIRLEVIMSIIREESLKGIEYSIRSFCDHFHGLKGRIGLGKKRLKQIIDDAIEFGSILYIPPDIPQKNVVGLLRLPE